MNCLTHGCTQVMVERFDPLIVLASIHKEKCTALYGVPTMFIAELNHPMFDMFDMSSLRTGIMAGSLCPVELMKQVEEKMYMKVTSVYGLTETAPGMTASRIDDPFDVRCNTVGHDFEFTEVKVIDPETGEECPVGVQGEMCNRGYNTMKGYYKNPEATAQIIDVNGWLHTGDLGVMDEEGYVTVRGRSKNMLLTSSGQNIYPEEIESKLNNMPYVAESLIVLQHDKLVALIYPDFDDAFAHGLQQNDIQKAMEVNRVELNQQLPNYCQISKIKIHFEEFEKTAKKSIKRFMYQEAKG